MGQSENETQANEAVRGLGVAPVFLVRDVPAAAAYYRAQLGFERVQTWGEPPCFAILTLGKSNIMLSKPEQAPQILPNFSQDNFSWDAYVWITDADAHFARCRAAGAKVVFELRDAPYGLREFAVMDVDGYVLCFGSEIG